jgi:hypothetical protein
VDARRLRRRGIGKQGEQRHQAGGDVDTGDRWARLFGDLEEQLAAQDRAAVESELADRTRQARGEVPFGDRLRASVGRPVTLRVAGAGQVEGVVHHVAEEWLLLGRGGSPVLVRHGAVLSAQRVSRHSTPTMGPAVAARLSLRSVLRGVARDRSPVRLRLVDGLLLEGTVDDVAHDHFDLACHPWDEPRRPAAVREHHSVLFSAVAVLTPAEGTSSLDR